MSSLYRFLPERLVHCPRCYDITRTALFSAHVLNIRATNKTHLTKKKTQLHFFILFLFQIVRYIFASLFLKF